jgi:hypothetical protein
MNISYNPTTSVDNHAFGMVEANKGNTTIVVFLFVIIVVFYLMFSFLGIGGLGNGSDALSSSGANANNGSSGFSLFGSSGNGSSTNANPRLTRLFEILVWAIFIVLIVVNGMQYLFNVNLTAQVKNLFSDKPEIEIEVDQPYSNTAFPVLKVQKQVFNIPGNYYNYEDAKAICDAYGARLASYNEMEEAYNKGAEWCFYGWSDNQMALFPTQKDTWQKLQKVKGHEKDCGRPGVNGGYIDNSKAKYGVNCYGHKPPMTAESAKLMQQTPIYPKNMNDIKHQEKVDYWRNKISDILVAPFSHDAWSIM